MTHKSNRILIVSSLDNSLIRFRGDFIKALIDSGFEVFCAAPIYKEGKVAKINALGAEFIEINLQRNGLNPLKDLRTFFELRRIMKQKKIDIVYPYTIKPVIYSSLAARSLGIPTFSLITGLGFTFSGVSTRAKILQLITAFLYRLALKKNKVVILQNKDDHQLFIDEKVMSKTQNYAIVDGSGINLKKFEYKERHATNDSTVKFIIVGRLIKEKGILLYIEAAKILKKKYPQLEFHVLGAPPDGNISSLSKEDLFELHDKGTIVYHGFQYEIIPYLNKADIFVLPSFYREGVPRSILEALALGMPIITTHMPGCKETVLEKENGFLINPNELTPLIGAIEFFVHNPDKISAMGKSSRTLAENRFDVNLINVQLINIIKSNL